MPSIVVALLLAVTGGPAAEPAAEPEAGPEAAAAPSGAPEASRLRLRSDRVEHGAVVRGLELRTAEAWRRWQIDVEDGDAAGAVEVRLTDRSGRTHARTLTLVSETTEDRSRELASALALVIDQLPLLPDPGPTEPTPTPTPDTSDPVPLDPASGWVGVGPRVGLNAGAPVDPDAGVSLAGGAWLLGARLHPLAEVSWSGGSRGSLRVDAVRVGAGLAMGSALAGGRWWLGGGALVRAQWSRAAAAATASGWWASPAAMGIVQLRGRWWVAGAWLGVDLTLPPLRADDGRTSIRWAPVRPMASLHVGLRLPPRRD